MNETGTMYVYGILQKWNEIILLSEEVRRIYLEETEDPALFYLYASKLSRLWIEMYPKVKGRDDLKELADEFNTYKKFAFNPDQANIQRLFELEFILRQILEELGITKFTEDVTV